MRLILLLPAIALMASCGDAPARVGGRDDVPGFMMRACGPIHRPMTGIPMRVSLPTTADPSYDAVLDYAVRWWHDAAPGLVLSVGRDDTPDGPDRVLIELVDVPVDQLSTVGDTSYQWDGRCVLVTTHVVINIVHPGTDAAHTVAEVLAHEVGHALGLDHDSDPSSLMYPVAHSSPFVLLPETRRSLSIVYGIPLPD